MFMERKDISRDRMQALLALAPEDLRVAVGEFSSS
jgi:hypothetical protein